MNSNQIYHKFKNIIPLIKKKIRLISVISVSIIVVLVILVTFINSTKINHLKNVNVLNTDLIEKSLIIEQEALKDSIDTNNFEIITNSLEEKQHNTIIETKSIKIDSETYEEVTFKSGDNFIKVLKTLDIDVQTSIALSDALGEIIPPNLIRVGDRIKIFINENNNKIINKVIFITKNEEILIKKDLNDRYKVSIIPPILEKKYSLKTLVVDETVYKTAQESKIPLDIINKIIINHSQDINFNKDIKDGDTVIIFYGTSINSKNNKALEHQLLYSSIKYKNDKNSEYFRYKNISGNETFYNSDGVSINKIIFIKPIKNSKITSSYGMRMHPVLGYERMHNGDDYKATLNTPIVATADGTIDFIGEKGDYGNYIRINHKNGLQSAYAHLNKYNKNIKNGDLIKQGEIIGYVGSSGLSTGPHLHYEIIRNGEKINPSKFAKNTSNIYLEGDDLQGFKKEYNRIIQLMKDY